MQIRQQQCIDEFNAAMRAEHELWGRLSGDHPAPWVFDRDVWKDWIAAVSRTNAACKAMREAITEHSPGDR